MAAYRDGEVPVTTPAPAPVPPRGVAVENEAKRPFRSFGEQCFAAVQYALGRGVDKRLLYTNDQVNRLFGATGAGETVSSEGGFFIQPDVLPGVIEPMYDNDPVLSAVQRVPVGTNATSVKMNLVDETSRATGSRWGGVRAYWAGEASSVTASNVKLRQFQFDLNKLMALCYLTDEQIQDAAQVEAITQRAFPAEMRFILTDAIWRGTGVGMPLGFMNSGAWVKQAIEATQTIATTNTFIAANLSKMRARLPMSSRANAIFCYNQELEPKFYTATLGNQPLYMPNGLAGGLADGGGRLVGQSAYVSEFAEAEGTPGDIVLLDPTQYLVIEKGGVAAATSLHVKFLTDEATLRWTYRVGGAPLWHTTLTRYKGTAALSPFVGLDTRS